MDVVSIVAGILEASSRVPAELERPGTSGRLEALLPGDYEVAQLPERKGDDVPAAMLAAVPGISTTSVRALLGTFRTVAAIAAADAAEWRRAPGIGARRAGSLRQALHGRRLPSPSRSEGPVPST